MKRSVRLRDVARTIRSKNAGVDHITFDVIFRSEYVYKQVKRNSSLSPELVAALYRLSTEDLASCDFYDPALALKFTIRRSSPAGTPGEPDVFGSQMYAPLLDVELSLEMPTEEEVAQTGITPEGRLGEGSGGAGAHAKA